MKGFDQLGKDAQKLGIAAEELQRLRYAADLSGVSSEVLGKSITKLSVGMADLADGTSDTAKALRAVGVQAGETSGQALERIADQFASMPDGIAKTTLAVQLFGKAGADMIPLLNGGAAALRDLAAEADRYGGIISGPVLKAAEQFNDNLSRLQRTAAGVGAQLAAGLLPGLQTLAQSMLQATQAGDGFVSTGGHIGEMLVNLYGFAIKAGATLEAFGLVIGAIMAVLNSTGDQPVTIWKELGNDIDNLDKNANAKLASLREGFAKFTKEASTTAVTVTTGTLPALSGLVESSDRAAKAAREHADAENLRWAALIKAQGATDAANTAAANAAVGKDIKAYTELNAEVEKWLDNIEDQGLKTQILTDWLETGTAAQQAYARAQLETSKASSTVVEATKKQTDEIDILTQGFEGFFQNLAGGAADAEEVFKRTIQSIIAELLKLWAKKYIIEAIFGKTTPAATGKAFADGQVLPFARGGVISRRTTFPMALAGEAGPEAILPLKRTASGDLGVQAQAPAMQVTVNNYSTATVSTRQVGPNELQVIVEQARAAIAADLRNGGNLVSKSLEAAYGIGRGSAAPY